MLSVLFVTSEARPLAQVGGLGEVAGSLPPALLELGCDIRVMLPAYPQALATAESPRPLARALILGHELRLLASYLPGTQVPAWLVDCPELFQRAGDVYTDARGEPWPDNAERFAVLAYAAAAVAEDAWGLGWAAELVHANDWPTALTPALLSQPTASRQRARRPATLFTIHNLAHQGRFPAATFRDLALPEALREGLSVAHGAEMAFIKGGLVYADRLNTVSPGYAKEIQTPALGEGMDEVIRARPEPVRGIVNGIDAGLWNPGADAFLAQPYDAATLDAKALNKTALQRELGLAQAPEPALVVWLGRLVEQKGVDVLLAALAEVMAEDVQLAVLGRGHADDERALSAAAGHWPGRLAVALAFDEGLAHRMLAGGDMLLMPSRFEPCGLSQLYAMRYATPPLVNGVGGLIDTVTDSSEGTHDRPATGFVFHELSGAALLGALRRALRSYQSPTAWRALQWAGMARDDAWRAKAHDYRALYGECLQARATVPP